MISKFFNKMKSAKALCIGAVCLLALVLLTAGIAWHVSGTVTGAGKSVRVNYYYANPKWSTMFNPYYSDSAIAGSTGKKLFDDRYVLWGSNPGGSFTLIGPGYVKTFAEFMTQNGNYANVATGTLLDCETYYLDKPDPTTQGLQWAYTFVGWHIVGADTYIPMETVFQMGDVIPAHVAEQYDTNADDGVIAINFETLWARCFFVQDATDANGAATGAGPYVYDRVNSQTETRYGNDPKNPLSSISEAYRARNTTFTDDVNINGTGRVGVATEIYNVTFNAYSHAIMLTGDTTCNRTNGASGEYRMFSPYYRAHSATIKSLQATRSNSGVITRSDGKRHKLTMGLYGFSSAEFYIIASTRFDNVDYYQDTELIFEVRDAYSYVDSAALPGDEIIKNNHYFETTSRFTTSKKSGLKDLYVRSYTCEKMVLNGGKLAGVYVGWVLPEKYSQDVLHTWYFGRNVDVSGSEFTTMIGFNSPEADGKPYSSNDRVIITGGHFTHFYGAGASMGDATAVTGNRDYLLYGKQNFGGNIKVDHTYEYDPRIDNFYGGGEYYKINGDITIKGYGCSYLKNLYAGGKFYPAVVTGNITSTFEDCDFSGVVSGGGQYADTSGDGKGIIDLTFKEGSTVTGNVYGSGMGYVTTFTKTETDVREKPADWETVAPTGFPAAEIQPDGSVWILTSRYKTIGSVTGSSDLRYIVRALYSFVSTAKANSTNVVVDNSTIQGDLFGGGDYASVVGDTHVTVQNNAIIGTSGTGSVFGGSDATTPMPALKLYKPYEGVYSAPTTTGQAVNYGTAYPNTFTWVDDESLKNAGIDFTNFRVYTDAKKGEVGGSTFVSVTSGAKVGHIFGGGNAGDVLGSTAIAIEDATVTNNVFGGCYAADVGGDVNITVNGSTSIGWYIFGGNDQDGAIGGNITTVMNGGTVKEDIYGSSRSTHFNNISTVKINGGTVENDVFGGGFEGNAGDTIVTVSGGTIKGNLYGGGDKGTANNTVININGGSLTFDAGTDHSGAAYSAYGLFGGGYGVQATVASTQVNIAGGSFNSAIYGGGYSGAVTGLAKVTVTVPGYVFPLDKNKVEDGRVYGLFGGGYRGSVGSTHVIFDNERCSVLAATYGGGYEGAVTGTAKIEVKQRYSQYKALYGGGYGENATVGNVDIDIANITTQENAVIYGGGNLGPVNGNVNIDIQDITTTGHIFGGGNQAQVGGNVVLNITGYASASGGDSKDEIYGGGRNGKVVGNITINLLDCVVTGNICGGGYEGAVDGSTSITIDGTTLGSTEAGTVYGGGFSGSVAGSTYILLQPNAHINGTVYGGGNRGSIGGSTEIHAYSNFINNIFGGCTAASVAKDTNVTQYDGAGINYHLYGGNQTSGDIGGKTTVTVKGGTVDGYVLGGGQNATTDATTYVIIEGGNVCVGAGTNEFGGVYGGGYQAGVGNTNVTIKGGTVGSDAWAGSVYGGSYGGGSRVTSTTVNMINGTVKGNVYGGGYSGAVDTNTAVTVSGGMATNVFGGGYKGDVDGNTALKVTGGELTAAFGGNDTSGRINGNITVDVEGGTIGQLYGGGSKAHIDADITDSITLNIKGGTVTDGFGGGMLAYTALTPKVTVTGGNVGTLYGGGYQATTVGSDVIVNNGTIGTLYGGGYAGAVGNTKLVIDDSGNNTNTITINGNVYGGGEGVTATVNESASVTINMNCSFTATESAFTTDQITPSGAVSTQITNLNYRSSIRGNVYDGGNLGRVGEGIIYVGGESAKVTSAGTTNVLVTNGYIAGSVFAGGRGIPGNGQSYDVSMGAIFGSTKVTINGGYIGKVDALQGEITGNVYGGGEQSRIFSNDKAADVLIEEVSGKSIAIKGSVFGGGDRGEEGATNASVPTVIGDVTVKIAGIENASSSNIYFLEGGVYGDGNLCLVNGNREIDIINFNAAGNLLKTFYSLQRADLVTMDNSAIVLLGAKDLVAENDNNNYSINRIGHLQMTDGSTVKLDQVVNYLGELTSDVHYNQYFIHLGNSGTIGQGGNGYTGHGCTDSCLVERLTTEKINAYRAGQLHNGEKNVVCVANGLYLEVMNEAGAYGPVKGLFTLQLLYANPGEGGGFVYGSIPESTGDFICETHKWDYIVANDVTAQTFDANKHFVRIAGRGYARTTDAFDANQTYYTAVETSEFMDIIDDVGGYRNSSYTHYYWYIGGDEIRYDVSITGYIGVGDTAFTSSVNVPQHAEDMAYVLHSVSANQTLLDALNAHTYTLDTDAIEARQHFIGFPGVFGWTVVCQDNAGSVIRLQWQYQCVGRQSFDALHCRGWW